jgi:hypothetical protein
MTENGILLDTAPVLDCKVQLVEGVSGPVAVGFAAPRSGIFPCAVTLSAGKDTLGVAKAARYSAEALNAGFRFGWCGFRVDGLERAAALHGIVEIRCTASGRVLAGWPSIDLLSTSHLQRPKPFLSVSDLRFVVKSAYGCVEPSHLEAFAQRFRQLRGDYALVEATYRWLLQRSPSSPEINDMIRGLGPKWDFLTVSERIMSSKEFATFKDFVAPGPFEANFPFDLTTVWS